jgi:hypothetical protein
VGQSRPSHSGTVLTFVCCCPKSDHSKAWVWKSRKARSGCHSKAASRPIPASISSMVGNEYESLIVFEPLPS